MSDEPGVSDEAVGAIAGLGDPVRRTLYRFVAAAPEPVGKDDAANHAGIGRSLAAYHLDRLVADGLLSVTYARRHGRRGPGAGRPAKLYAASRTEFRVELPPRDDTLLARLFAAAVEEDRTGSTRGALERVARAEGTDAAATCRRGDDGIGEMLAARGYAPAVSGNEIRMRNCPFHHLVDEHRDLVCGLNLALLDAAVNALGSAYRAELDPAPDRCCVVLRRADRATSA